MDGAKNRPKRSRQTKARKGPGRPPLPSAEGKRFALGLRVTAERRRALEEAAARSGRSISQEIELRLEQSFQDESALGGREMLGLFRMMAGVAAVIEERRNGKRWSEDWETFLAVRKAWHAMINSVCPELSPEWIERLRTLQASDPGPSPGRPPALAPSGPGMLSGIFGLTGGTSEAEPTDPEERARLYADWQQKNKEWEEAANEWIARATDFSNKMTAMKEHLTQLEAFGTEVANGMLRPNRLIEVLMRSRADAARNEEP